MLRIARSMRGLQRRFATIVLASVLVFLVYLLLSNSGHLQQSPKSVQDRAAALEQQSLIQDNGGDLSQVHRMQQRDKPILINGQPLVKLTAPPKDSGGVVGNADKDSPAQVVSDGVKASDDKVQEEGQAKQEQQQDASKNNAAAAAVAKDQEGAGDKPVGAGGADLPPLATDLSNPYSGPRNREQQEIVGAFLHAWKYYKKYAWGHDELKPVSKGWQEWMGIGLTIVDSLDTMYMMGLKDEFDLSREWVAKSLSFNKDNDVQLFEITIRALGGLLSAYHLSGDKVFLDKALELGGKLYPCFGGHNKVPCNRISLRRGRPHFIEISTAESGTIQLEFRDLARASGNNKFELAVAAVSDHIHKLPKLDGLVPCFLNAHTGEFRTSATVSMGASADSYYEYLLKQWLQTGKTKDWMRTDYLEAMEGMKSHLYRKTFNEQLSFVGAYVSMNSKSFRPEMEHLACFLPGTLALGYMSGLELEDHLKMAENLTRTCYEMYRRTPTGLSPEVAAMGMNANTKSDVYVSSAFSYNLQRPEAVESIFYMYRLTKDPKYRRWGWEIFQAFEKYTRLEDGGYASISNVKNTENPGYRDKMETFYLAETLKYLYLLFSDDPDLIPLDKFVINTEAHPLPVYTS